MKTTKFLAMWDMNGLEYLADITKIEKDVMWSTLKGEKSDTKFPNLKVLIIRAQANIQRHYEIYVFDSQISEKEIKELFETSPQTIVDAIRDCGTKVYSNRARLEERAIV